MQFHRTASPSTQMKGCLPKCCNRLKGNNAVGQKHYFLLFGGLGLGGGVGVRVFGEGVSLQILVELPMDQPPASLSLEGKRSWQSAKQSSPLLLKNI